MQPRRASLRLERRDLLRVLGAASLSPLVGCQHQTRRKHASLWFSYGGRNREVLERLVARFNQQSPEYFIDAVYQGDYFEGLAKLRTAIAARAAPTLSHVVGEVIPYLERAGVLQPLDDFPGASELDIVDSLGQAGSWENGGQHPLVALPFNRSTPIAYLNADLFERTGLRAPETWGDLRACAKELTERRGRRTVRHGFGCPVDWWFWVALVGQAGGRLTDSGGRAVLGGEAGREAIELWQTLIHEDGSMKPPPGRDYNAWEQTNQDFLAGRTAMIWTSTAFLHYIEDNAPFRVHAARLPKKTRHAVPTGGTHWVIPRGASPDSQRAAWAFLRFMHATDQVVEWATSTGYLPVTRSAITHLQDVGYYSKHPNDRASLDQLDVAMPWPWAPELFRIQREIVEPRLERAVLAREDARAILDEARRLATGAPP